MPEPTRAEHGKCLEPTRHIRIDGAVRELERACDDLGDFVARVKGESTKGPVVRGPVPDPSLAEVLTSTPVRLMDAHDQIRVYLKELSGLLF